MTNNIFTILIFLVLWILILVLFYFITNKTKYKSIISKIIMLTIIGIAFYNIFTKGFEKGQIGIFKGTMILGTTWGLIFAVHAKHIFNTIELIFLACLVSWLVSFGIACLEFANIPFETTIKNVALVGLGLSAISTLLGAGEFFSFSKDDYEDYFDAEHNEKTHKKIRAETFHWGKNLSTTTYKDDKGNKVEIDHWHWR